MQSSPSQIADALRQLSQSDTLRDLETRLAAQNAFNLFEAIGVSNQELRHSDFLAFLLRPYEIHGLGDTFLKWFLGHALAHSPAPRISQGAVAAWDLSDAHVQREWNNVDLFITSAQNRLAVVVENKIYTGEHDDQLTRYMETAKGSGHGGNDCVLLGVFLTPHGGKPSHDDYLPIGYEAVCAHLEKLCKTGEFARAASPDVDVTVRHYNRMLRRRIVGDPEITKICRELYAKHQTAFDRVFDEVNIDTKPTQRAVTNQLKEWISNRESFEVAGSHFYKSISILHFGLKSWTNEKALLRNELTKWFIYLQTETHSNGKVIIQGIIAPCKPTLRARLLQVVRTAFQNSSFETSIGYAVFYTYTLRPSHFEAVSQDDDALRDAWNEWVNTEGPKFAALIQPGDFHDVYRTPILRKSLNFPHNNLQNWAT